MKGFLSRGRDGLVSAKTGFTLVELLIVIAILAILAAAVVMVLNPSELMAQARDAERVADLSSIKKAISLWTIDANGVSEGSSQTVYISIPDTSATCANISGLPVLPAGWTYNCVTAANLRNTNGTGWVPLDFSIVKGGSPIPYLPIDPVNDAVVGKYYTYTSGGSYELTAMMEADKKNISLSDGGSLPGVYQLGTHIGLTPPIRDQGLIGYWTFDGSGSIANGQTAGLSDSSGKGNNGIASNTNGGGMIFTAAKSGNGLQFDGVDDYVSINANSIFTTGASGQFSYSAWVKSSNYTTKQIVVSRTTPCSNPGVFNIYTESNAVKLTFYSNLEVGESTHSSSAVLQNGNFHHLVWTKKWGQLGSKLYIDGNLVSISGDSSRKGTTYNDPIFIGAQNRVEGFCGSTPSPSLFFSGVIDDVRIYDRILSAEEIKSIYDATK